jgi:hypothetical protein
MSLTSSSWICFISTHRGTQSAPKQSAASCTCNWVSWSWLEKKLGSEAKILLDKSNLRTNSFSHYVYSTYWLEYGGRAYSGDSRCHLNTSILRTADYGAHIQIKKQFCSFLGLSRVVKRNSGHGIVTTIMYVIWMRYLYNSKHAHWLIPRIWKGSLENIEGVKYPVKETNQNCCKVRPEKFTLTLKWSH